MIEQINHPIVKRFLQDFGNDDLFQKWESFTITQRFFYSVVKPLFDENIELRKKCSQQVLIEPEEIVEEQEEDEEPEQEAEDELLEPSYDTEPSFEQEMKEVKKKLTKPEKEKQKRMEKVRELLKENPDSTSADVMNLIGVTEGTALSYLKELEEE